MSIEDWIPDFDGDWLYRTLEDQTCSRCGAFPLHWKRLEGRWRLVTFRGRVHDCQRAKPSEFPDLNED